MDKENSAEQLYEENQRLGYRINYLNDENNFYRISINNIKKLSQNINKRLQTSNPNSRNLKGRTSVDPSRIADAYAAVTSQIQLKNLQMRVGSMKRRVDKMQKLHEGSISSLVKQSQQLEHEVNVLARNYEFSRIQSEFLDNIYLDDYLIARVAAQGDIPLPSSLTNSMNRSLSRGLRSKTSGSERVAQLQDQQIRLANKLELMAKEENQLRKQSAALQQTIDRLKEQRETLAIQVYSGFNLRVAQAKQIASLQQLSEQEELLLEEIARQDLLLEQQYKMNEEYKQKILDRNQLQMKDIKSLQDKIKKRSEEVREMKLKCDNLELNKNKNSTNIK